MEKVLKFLWRCLSVFNSSASLCPNNQHGFAKIRQWLLLLTLLVPVSSPALENLEKCILAFPGVVETIETPKSDPLLMAEIKKSIVLQKAHNALTRTKDGLTEIDKDFPKAAADPTTMKRWEYLSSGRPKWKIKSLSEDERDGWGDSVAATLFETREIVLDTERNIPLLGDDPNLFLATMIANAEFDMKTHLIKRSPKGEVEIRPQFRRFLKDLLEQHPQIRAEVEKGGQKWEENPTIQQMITFFRERRALLEQKRLIAAWEKSGENLFEHGSIQSNPSQIRETIIETLTKQHGVSTTLSFTLWKHSLPQELGLIQSHAPAVRLRIAPGTYR